MSGSNDDIRANRNEQETDDWKNPVGMTLAEYHRSMWLVTLEHMPHVANVTSDIMKDANVTVSGRALDSWRPLIVIASWLDGLGVVGLKAKMVKMCEKYQDLRLETTQIDLTTLVAYALVDKFSDISDISDICKVESIRFIRSFSSFR